MRPIAIAFALAVVGGVALCNDAAGQAAEKPTFASLMEDSEKSKYLREGIKLTRNYFRQYAEEESGKKGASVTKIEREREKWRQWIDGSKEAIGFDLYKYPGILTTVLDEGRFEVIADLVKLKKGVLDYGSKNAPGYSRNTIDYTVLLPKDYDPMKMQGSLPLVVTMHGRAINLRHPSLKKSPEERSRIVVWNNWLGSRTVPAQNAVVLAPTGRPEGYSFEKAPDFARQTFFLAMGVGQMDYRTDALGTFIEVYGDMIQIASEYSNLFAGIIWRDREDQQNAPVSDEELMIFDNLNGRPFYYVADTKMWDKVGKPMSEALKAAYQRAGKPENLIIEQVERDANGALRANEADIAKFLEHRLAMPQREFKWSFWHPNLVGPMPMLLTRADYTYDATPDIAKMPLRERCGTIEFKVGIEMVKDERAADANEDGEGKGKDDKVKEIPVNVFDLKITEAQSAILFLYEDMVDLDLPVTVKVNGNIVIDRQMVKRDWGLFEQVCMPRRFFTFPIVAQLDFGFPVMPRVAPPAVPVPGDGAEEEKKDAPTEQPTDGAKEAAGN